MAYTKHTWVTDELITADKMNNLESGALDLSVPIGGVTGTDPLPNGVNSILGLVNYYVNIYKSNFEKVIVVVNSSLTDSPSNYNASVKIDITVRDVGRSYVLVSDPIGGVYSGSYANGKLESAWVMLAKDSTVLHKTGDESASGNKSFTGNVSIGGSVMNYATIPSISINGYISGSLRISKQSGMVSINSMDLVLAKGATFTLPSGYYPRAQLQAPITGQNSAGTTAGGYMTIGVDGSVVFNSMGFASGNATAYVNVHYIAQV